METKKRHNSSWCQCRMALLCAVVLLTACVGGAKIPEDHYYRLPQVESKERYASPLLEGDTSVNTVMASGILDGRSILYVTGDKPNELKYYAYRHWIDSPSKLIHQHFVRYLEKTRAAQVSLLESESPRNGVVQIQLLRFERGVLDDRVEARVSLKIGYKTSANTEFAGLYSSTVQAVDISVSNTVKAFGEALENIYADWLRDIKSHNAG